MRLSSLVAALCLAANAMPVCARPFTVEDLLAAEEFGQMAFTPDGRRLVFERQVPFKEAGPFEYDAYPPLRRSRIYVADVGSSAPPRLLLTPGPGEGHTAGPISPSGRYMAVLRLKGRDWEAGVVTLASGEVRWLGVIPELAQLGQTVAWRSDHELVIAARSSIPLRLRAGWQAHETLQAQWAAAARGELALTEVSSLGAYAGQTAPTGALVLIDAPSGRTRTLIKGDFYDLQVSPDGREVAAMANLEAVTPDPAPRVVATPNRRRNLFLVNLDKGTVSTPCADCDLSPHLMAWSPNALEVLVHGRRQGQAWSQARLMRLTPNSAGPVASGDLELALGRTSEGHVIPRASWLGGAPIALMARGGGRADWYQLNADGPLNLTAAMPGPPGARLLANDGQAIFAASAGAVWRVTPSGAALLASSAAPLGVQGLSLSSRERQNVAPSIGWFRARHGERPALASTGGQVAPLTSDGRAIQTIAQASASASIVANAGGGLDLLLTASERRTLMSLNRDFSAIDFASVREIRGKAPSGDPLTHYLLLPPKPRSTLPPLIVVPYPGLDAYPPPRPYGGGTGRFPTNAELMAAAGYAVLVPALPRPKKIEPGEGLADQILEAVDLAAAQAGGFDPAHPILWGQSFGGYTVLMAATQSDRFAAVIASAAPSNLSSVRGVFDPHGEARPQDGLSAFPLGWSEDGQAGLGASPWEAPDLYVRNSPVFQAGHIASPVLLIHGDIDFVRLSQAQEMFSALARQAKDVTLITAHGEGHIIATPGNLREIYSRAFRWLAKRTGARQAEP